jgi:hypothetical protein
MAMSELESATAFALGKTATDNDRMMAEKLFAPLGAVVQVDESQMSDVTALSGSGPAYFCRLCEAMAKAAADNGFDPESAEKLAVQTLIGTAKLLSELDISEAHALQRTQTLDNSACRSTTILSKELDSLADTHFEHITDTLIAIFNLEHLLFESAATTRLTRQLDVGHKLHTHFDDSLALTLLATTTGGIEREVGRCHAGMFGKGLVRKQATNLVIGFDIGNGVGTRGFADRVLVDHLDSRQQRHVARKLTELARVITRLAQQTSQRRVKHTLDK